MMAEGEVLHVRDPPERVRVRAAEAKNEDSHELLPFAEVERRHVLRVLDQVGGNKVHSARTPGISRATVYRVINEAGPGEVASAATT